jgi:DNA-binding NarL/FixJ family response regulator
MPNSVLIVDDSYVVRQVMRDFFETMTDCRIVGEAGDGAEAIHQASELRPDLILLDFSMPELNGIETASILKKMLPHAHIVVFTMYDGALGSRLSLAVGVDLVVSKTEGLNGLVDAVNYVLGTAGLIKNKSKTNRLAASTTEQS